MFLTKSNAVEIFNGSSVCRHRDRDTESFFFPLQLTDRERERKRESKKRDRERWMDGLIGQQGREGYGRRMRERE